MPERSYWEDVELKRISRRRLLAGTGVGAVGLLLAAACGTGNGGSETPTAGSASGSAGQMPKTISVNQDCSTQDDPVNLVFHGPPGASAGDVYGALTGPALENRWTSPDWYKLELPAVTAYICDNGGARGQDEQAVKDIDWRSRHHVRLWNYNGGAIGSAHAETVSLKFTHEVTSFEDGEHEVANDLKALGWSKQADSMQVGPDHSPMDDGRATELTP